MPTCPVAETAEMTARTNAPSWARRVRPATSATSAGRSSRSTMPALAASSRSWAQYAIRSAQLTIPPSTVVGTGRDQEWLRIPSRVCAHRFRPVSTTSAPHGPWS